MKNKKNNCRKKPRFVSQEEEWNTFLFQISIQWFISISCLFKDSSILYSLHCLEQFLNMSSNTKSSTSFLPCDAHRHGEACLWTLDTKRVWLTCTARGGHFVCSRVPCISHASLGLLSKDHRYFVLFEAGHNVRMKGKCILLWSQ